LGDFASKPADHSEEDETRLHRAAARFRTSPHHRQTPAMRILTILLVFALVIPSAARRPTRVAADETPTKTRERPAVVNKPAKKPPVDVAETTPVKTETQKKKSPPDQPVELKKKPGGKAAKETSDAKTTPRRAASSQALANGVGSSRAMSTGAVKEIIDGAIAAQLSSTKIPTSPAADDFEFLRRLYLDLHGVVPTSDQVREFVADPAADKRANAIDRLLADRRFAAHLADLWDDYLIPATDDGRPDRQRFTARLEEAFASQSWDAIAYDLLTAAGKREENAAVVYLLKGRETLTPAELTDLTSQYFLGMRLNCAQCHDHPFTSWKQTDYWGVAAFFTEIQYTDRRMQKSGLIRDDDGVAVDKLENAAKLRTPRFLSGEAPKAESGISRRAALARWITSADNPYFARAMVNRTWSQLFGRGLVEPVDDMHPDSPATHPELLATLTREFTASGFDLRALYRATCNSAAYQRTSMPTKGNEQDATLYSRMAVKVLTPEQLHVSLALIVPTTGRAKGGGAKGDPRDEFVQFFRSEADAGAIAYTRGIPQTLRMMNSPQLFSPPNEAATVRRIVEPATSTAEALERIYLHVLARKPTADERSTLNEFLASYPGETDEAYGEILWALVNGSEFSLNR
jgi:hypothetical protein